MDAGLSLAELADGQVTKNAIHLIETGRSRPSATTLAHIARMTGKPLSYFLAEMPDRPPRSPEDIARMASDHLRRSTWTLSHLLKHDDLTGPERVAVEELLKGVRGGVRLVHAIHPELAHHRTIPVDEDELRRLRAVLGAIRDDPSAGGWAKSIAAAALAEP
jgi:transcriptional regulator with XRE-family HTH domain